MTAATSGERTCPSSAPDSSTTKNTTNDSAAATSWLRVTADAGDADRHRRRAEQHRAEVAGGDRSGVERRRRWRAGRRRRASVGTQAVAKKASAASHLPSTTSPAVTGAVSSGSMVPLRSSSAIRRIGATVASSASAIQYSIVPPKKNSITPPGGASGLASMRRNSQNTTPCSVRNSVSTSPAGGRAEVGLPLAAAAPRRIALTTTSPSRTPRPATPRPAARAAPRACRPPSPARDRG